MKGFNWEQKLSLLREKAVEMEEKLQLIKQETTPEDPYQNYMYQQALDYCNDAVLRETFFDLNDNKIKCTGKQVGFYIQMIEHFAQQKN